MDPQWIHNAVQKREYVAAERWLACDRLPKLFNNPKALHVAVVHDRLDILDWYKRHSPYHSWWWCAIDDKINTKAAIIQQAWQQHKCNKRRELMGTVLPLTRSKLPLQLLYLICSKVYK